MLSVRVALPSSQRAAAWQHMPRPCARITQRHSMLQYMYAPNELSSIAVRMPKPVHLQAQLGTAPVTALHVVPNFVVSAQANPMGQRPVLLGLLCQDLLNTQCLVRWHGCTVSAAEYKLL